MPKELTPTFTVISKACDGDETAISKILEFYDPYINQCCMRPFYDDNNNLRLAVQIAIQNGHLCHVRRSVCDIIGGQPKTN